VIDNLSSRVGYGVAARNFRPASAIRVLIRTGRIQRLESRTAPAVCEKNSERPPGPAPLPPPHFKLKFLSGVHNGPLRHHSVARLYIGLWLFHTGGPGARPLMGVLPPAWAGAPAGRPRFQVAEIGDAPLPAAAVLRGGLDGPPSLISSCQNRPPTLDSTGEPA
jgi:hypothetical protein